jgi:Glycosyl transferase family 2
MSSTPDVSVVIPTYSRPDLVARAVRSALAQTIRDIEVIVVVDGPDDATRRELSTIADPRLRVIGLPRQLGAPNARNVGAHEARAPWTALLDDDDEWLPHKLDVQLGLARTATVSAPIIASRLINRTPRAEFVLPARLPAPGEPLSEYLTVRRGLFHGDGFIQTSTIMAPTELLRRVPFAVGLRRLQELDWTLRAASYDDVELIVAPEPLVVWHTDENRPRVSFDLPWQQQLEWLRRSRALFTARAYAALTMSVISSMAAPTRDAQIFRTLLREARGHGRPSAIDYVTFLQVWLIPPQARARVRDLVLARRRPTQQAAGRSTMPAGAALSPAKQAIVRPAPDRIEWRTTVPSDRVDTRR